MPSISKTVAAALLFASLSPNARAQIPGTPLLQNAFANPGITAAVDFASLGSASSFAAAGAWAPGSARFQFSGGIGAQTRSGSPTRTAYGVRLNIPLLSEESSLGLSLFAGYGGLSGGGIDSSTTKSVIPLGATVGYRIGLGGNHGLSIYGSPVYEAVGRGGGAGSASVFRGAVGLDFGITSSIGATLGIEFGPSESAESGKPSGTAFGFALSYAIGGGR
ncbi:MAG TPA: hypothetical protein VGH98_23935 [Gemmatimonadaceae bacterium]|jgi:hypothetical protein